MNNENSNATRPIDGEVVEQTSYDVILAQQSFTTRDLTEHMTGPVIAIILHLILIPILLTVVIFPPPEEQSNANIEMFEEDIVTPPEEPPPEEPPPEEEREDIEEDRPETADVEEEDNKMDDEAVSEDLNSDPTPVLMTFDNNSNKTLNQIGVGKQGGRGGKGFGRRGGRRARDTKLEGTFIDFKLGSDGTTPTGISSKNNRRFCNELRDFVLSPNWDLDALAKKYYRSPINLYNSFFYIPLTSAEDAPKYYECADKCQASCWIAVYTARVMAPKDGTFRFAGVGDDAILVRMNKKTVLDNGWYMLSSGDRMDSRSWRQAMMKTGGSEQAKAVLEKLNIYTVPTKFYTYNSTPEWNGNLGGICVGEPITVKAGDIFEMEILVTEIPGGKFGAALLVEEVGVEYKKEGNSPILSLFRVDNKYPEQGGHAPPFDAENSPIWRVVSKNYKPEAAKKTNDTLITL